MDSLEPTRLHYGIAFGSALHKRLRDHFASLDNPDAPREAPLTVGLFGGWGSGKTLHLECLRDRVLAESLTAQTLTLPVLFNAWRHETEAHLIVPLLKTTHHTLNRWLAEQKKEGDKARDAIIGGLKSTTIKLKDAALALAAGLSGKLSVPGVGEIGYSGKDMLAEDAKRKTARKSEAPSTAWFKRLFEREQPAVPRSLVDLDVIYHDFETHLSQLTGIRGSGTRLNLLFLIDDLDRCLPEKAVQMLESIKLFLDVPGCAFVLALDDEVVERGIAHRYRDYKHAEPAWDSVAYALHPSRFEDYRAERDHQAVGPANPVTGHEYLEKMVQLPVYVPRPGDTEVRSYLVKHYPSLFEPLPSQLEPDPRDPTAPPHDRNAAENATREKLLALIRAVPANPRKLNRLAELYAFQLKVAEGNGWKIESERERLTLLRLVAVQLLAPELYRFGQDQSSFVAKFEEWLKDEAKFVDVSGRIEARNRALREKYKDDPSSLSSLERLDERLLAHLRNAQSQRSGFDPLRLLDINAPCDAALLDFYRLARDVSSPAATAATVGVAVAGAVAQVLTGQLAALANPRVFVDQLLSADPLAWRNALAQEAEALAGRVLDDFSFAALLNGIQTKPEHVTLAWLEPLAPYLTPAQLYRLYQESGLLRRLNAAIIPEVQA